MPIQPRFSLSQDESFVIARVHVPHVRVGGTEVDIDECQLSIFCPPYLLKLVLPGPLVDDERARASYDPGEAGGTLTVHAPKAAPGQHFPDLDLTARLLAPAPAFPTPRGSSGFAAAAEEDGEGALARALQQTLTLAEGSGGAPKRPSAPPMIEVLSSHDFDAEAPLGSSQAEEPAAGGAVGEPPPSAPALTASAGAAAGGAASDGSLLSLGGGGAEPASAAASQPPSLHLRGLGGSGSGYGFNRSVSGMFSGDLRSELAVGLLALPDPENTPPLYRTALRCAAEMAAWSPQRYQGDFFDGEEEGAAFLASSAAWWLAAQQAPTASGPGWAWTEEEASAMASLPRKEYLIDGALVSGGAAAAAAAAAATPAAAAALGPETTRLLTGLTTLLFAYAYDVRFTSGEATVESAWTVCTLSPLLSWLDDECLLGGVPPPAEALQAGPEALAAAAASAESQQLHLLPQQTPTLALCIPAALLACVTRALTYPYLRRWDTAIVCAQDARALLAGGRRSVLRALLALRRLLGSGGDTSEGSSGEDHKYLLNSLFLNDYCAWVQYVSEERLSDAALAVGEALHLLAKDAPQLAHLQLGELELMEEEGEEEEEEE